MCLNGRAAGAKSDVEQRRPRLHPLEATPQERLSADMGAYEHSHTLQLGRDARRRAALVGFFAASRRVASITAPAFCCPGGATGSALPCLDGGDSGIAGSCGPLQAGGTGDAPQTLMI